MAGKGGVPQNIWDNIDLKVPGGRRKILLHTCCAPCSGFLVELMLKKDLDITVLFYNPNIHPKKEYEIRKQENIRFAEKFGLPFVDGDYDVDNWFDNTEGMGNDPERGRRCGVCFDMRFLYTAKYAEANGFEIFTTSLAISRHKDKNQVDASGHLAASMVKGVEYWDYNWRKKGGSNRNQEISKEQGFYRQQYCGCVYSLRDANNWRKEKGLEPLAIGTNAQIIAESKTV
ncbi:epoxyqueuosine reductase QueH [Rickettsiales bacterium]|nr:epoxyqueuosine reductase QueH [Rickettsiales bacterium]